MAKYFVNLYRPKIFAVSFQTYIQLVLKISFTSFPQPALIETDSIVNFPITTFQQSLTHSAMVGCSPVFSTYTLLWSGWQCSLLIQFKTHCKIKGSEETKNLQPPEDLSLNLVVLSLVSSNGISILLRR